MFQYRSIRLTNNFQKYFLLIFALNRKNIDVTVAPQSNIYYDQSIYIGGKLSHI